MYWNDLEKEVKNLVAGLTLTWDVLKFWQCEVLINVMVININMRCIEIE